MLRAPLAERPGCQLRLANSQVAGVGLVVIAREGSLAPRTISLGIREIQADRNPGQRYRCRWLAAVGHKLPRVTAR